MIDNCRLSNLERQWLEHILSVPFVQRDDIVKQINDAEIVREYTDGYLSLQFRPSVTAPPLSIQKRVPVEMRAFREDKSPIQFLLHIVNGYVSELEIFCADSSDITPEIELQNAKLKIIVEPSLL